jgi:ABC-type nickel/cobalt efflux system permease component RcnA
MSMHRRFRAVALAASTTVVVMTALAPPALAHPLGNFTINHYAGLRVAPDRISLDVVIDRAEIPAFQELQRLDPDGNGALTPSEAVAAGRAGCRDLAPDLHLAVGGSRLDTTLVAAGLTLPPGTGGLPTMRLVCEYDAILTGPISSPATVSFEDSSFAERIGWREIVVVGDRTIVTGGEAAALGGVSARLTSYPSDLLAQPLDMRAISVNVRPGGPALASWAAPDATPLGPAADAGEPSAGAIATSVVPGGVVEGLAGLIDVANLSPLAILAALAIAFGLGVVHALSPGHGKTIMAAYLVGGRGTTRQAIGLGLAVAASHTLGVLGLAVITIAASSVLPPERLYPILGLVSGALVVVIGVSLLWSRVRVLRNRRAHAREHEHGHPHSHEHSHEPPEARISWRGLIALGLSGGLVPSASALILLLGSIAAGVPGYGLVLVTVFGLGMAVVLGGVGLAIVHARRFLEARPTATGLARVAAPIQLMTASLVILLGVALTGQALAQVL